MTRKKAISGTVFGLAMTLASGGFSESLHPIKNVLHFSRVGYFAHPGGIKGCTGALNALADRYHFMVKHSDDYNDVAVLAENPEAYDIVIFDNTTDAGGVNNNENAGQRALRDWLTNRGGRYLGLHSASDHRSQWSWYDTVLYSGIQFALQNQGQFSLYRDTSEATRENPALQNMYRYAADSLGLSTEVVKFNTEYYRFKDSKTNVYTDVRGRPGVTSFQELRGQNAYPFDTNESVGWIKALPNHGRFIYTALGHENAEWTANNGWLTKMTWAYMKYLMGDFDEPVSAIAPRILVQGQSLRVVNPLPLRVRILDLAGRLVASGTAADFGTTLAKAGVYFVAVQTGQGKAIGQAITIP
jgi:hypothetical protein